MNNKPVLTSKVFIATSLDGFIARENGAIDWLEKAAADQGEDYGYAAFMATINGIIMGRKTYQQVLTFGAWPYKCPVIVMSKTLSAADVPEKLKDKVEINAGTPKTVCELVSARGWRAAYIDGGQLIQSFLNEEAISELIITRLPILLGKGRSLFGELKGDVLLQHVATTSYPAGLVQSHYKIAPSS